MNNILSAFEDRINKIPPAGITILILAVASAAILPAWIHYDIIARDGALQYIPTAKLFYGGDIARALSQQQLPLFPFAIAVFSLITSADFETSGRLVAVIAYIIAAFGMFRAGALICRSRLCGLLSLVFFITNWVVVSTSVDCLQESLQLAFIIWANICIFHVVLDNGKHGWIYLLIGLSLFVIGSAVRTTTMIFPFSWFLLWVFHKKKNMWPRVGILLILIIVPAFIVIYFKDMAIFHEKKGFQVYTYLGMAPDLIGKLRSFPDTLGMIFDKGHAILMSLAVIGLIFSKTVMIDRNQGLTSDKSGTNLLHIYRVHAGIVLVLFLLMFFIMGWTTSRYILAPIIWLYPLVACVSYCALMSGRKTIRWFIALTVLSCVVIWGCKSFTPPDPDKVAIREAGVWIYSEVGPEKRILTNRDRLAFYAKTKFNPITSIKDIRGNEACIAVDMTNDGGENLVNELDSNGYKPEKKIGPIYLYMPEGRNNPAVRK